MNDYIRTTEKLVNQVIDSQIVEKEQSDFELKMTNLENIMIEQEEVYDEFFFFTN